MDHFESYFWSQLLKCEYFHYAQIPKIKKEIIQKIEPIWLTQRITSKGLEVEDYSSYYKSDSSGMST